jgi:cellulose synthase/poly-beta-1,6-N-acetylglucosamine synthase-like glycosyltransferase
LEYFLSLSPTAARRRHLQETKSLAGGNSIFRREVFEKGTEFNENAIWCEDTVLSFSLVRAGHRLIYADDVVVLHDRHYKSIRAIIRHMYLYGTATARLGRMLGGRSAFAERSKAIAFILFAPSIVLLLIAATVSHPLIVLLIVGSCVVGVLGKAVMGTRSISVALLIPVVALACLLGFSSGFLAQTLRGLGEERL